MAERAAEEKAGENPDQILADAAKAAQRAATDPDPDPAEATEVAAAAAGGAAAHHAEDAGNIAEKARELPEDFSCFGYRVFRRKLFRTVYRFKDDVAITSGQARNNEAVP